jgi:class 3 adenylate cyclase
LAFDLLEEIYHNAQIYANFVSGAEEHIFSHRTKLLGKMLKDSKELLNLKHDYDSLKLEDERLRSRVDGFSTEIQVLRSENEKLLLNVEEFMDISKIPKVPEARYCAALIADLSKSTWVLASVDFKDRGDIFNRYIMHMKDIVVKHSGFFDKFTGDGLIALFGLEKPDGLDDNAKKQICMNAITCASEIAAATESFFKVGDVDKIIKKTGTRAPVSRISLSSGEIAFGRFGGCGTALGIPIVQAARIISKKEFFSEEKKIIYTEQFLNDLHLPVTQIPKSLEQDFLIEGSFKINVYPSHI